MPSPPGLRRQATRLPASEAQRNRAGQVVAPRGAAAPPAPTPQAVAPQASAPPAVVAPATLAKPAAAEPAVVAEKPPHPVAKEEAPPSRRTRLRGPSAPKPVAQSEPPRRGDHKAGNAVMSPASNVRVQFPFAMPTPAAMFLRAQTLWLVFDTTARIDVAALANEPSRNIRSASVMRVGDAQVVRLRLDGELRLPGGGRLGADDDGDQVRGRPRH